MNARLKPDASGRRTPTTLRFAKLKLLLLVAFCALPVYGVVTIWLRDGSWLPWLPAAIYLVMSVITFGLYGYDKRQARGEGRRTPEKLLHGLELLGGWPGALVAQQVFRHKTRKVAFQVVFWLIVLLHELFWIDRIVLGGNFIARHFY